MAEQEHIAKYKRLRKKTEKIIDTTNIHHSGAYIAAADKILKDKEGLIEYDLLKQPEYQKKFVDAMKDYYIEKAEKAFKIKIKDRDEFEKELLMNAYAGVTKAKLTELVKKYRHNFTLPQFEHEKQRFLHEVGETLKGVSTQHFKEEHIDDIIKHMNIGNLVNPKYMRLNEALELLEQHTEHGGVPENMLEYQPYYKKKKK